MKINSRVREKYIEICFKSASKCNTYADIDYKIIRAVELGQIVFIAKNEVTYGYYNLRFVVSKNQITDMFVDLKGKNVIVRERVKNDYDQIHMKLVV